MFKERNTRIIASCIFGLVVSTCLVLGYALNVGGKIQTVSFPLLVIFLILVGTIGWLSYFVMSALDKHNKNKHVEREVKLESKTFIKKGLLVVIFSVFILVLWMPSFLGVYPGWFNYDAPWQLSMFKTGDISAHQPVLHTLFLGTIIEGTHQFFVQRGDWEYNYNRSIALYTLIQMGLSAVVMGTAVMVLSEEVRSRLWKNFLRIAMIGYFGLFPPIVLLVMSPTKDVFFGLSFMIFCLVMQSKQKDEKGRNWIYGLVWSAALFLCIALRQNSLYALLLLLIPVMIYLIARGRKKDFLSVLLYTAIAIFAYVLLTGPVYYLLNVKAGSKAEFLPVPCQQVVSVYIDHRDELNPEEIELIERAFEKEAFTEYRLKIADATKGALTEEFFASNKGEYIKLYLSLAIRYPKDFWNSFLLLNYGFWYPDAVLDLYEDGRTLYFASEYRLPAQESSKIPILLNYYRNFYTGFPVQGGGSITWILMPAVWFFLNFFTFLYVFRRKNVKGIIITGAALLIWLTFLLGPCVSIRYVFYLYLLAPLNIILLLE